jgi:hypothetical protein
MGEHCFCRPTKSAQYCSLQFGPRLFNSYIGEARPTHRSRSAVIGCSPLSNIEQISIQLRCNILAGRVSNSMGNLMPESQLTVRGKRPIGMGEPRRKGKPHPPAVLIDLGEPQGIARGVSE